MKIINFFKKKPDILLPVFTAILVTSLVLLLVFDKKCKDCTESKVGVIKAVDPMPSSFNSKTVIKVEKTFYVVFGFPQLNVGDSLIAKMDDKKIVSIIDDTGEWYDVQHKMK
jgi:hypothetical protein